MNEKWKSLYKALSSNPNYKLGSEQEFYDKFSNKENAAKLHAVLMQDKNFKVQETPEDFYNQFFFSKDQEDTQPSTTTLQPTGDTTPQQQEVLQQDTQFPSWRDVQPPISTTEQQDATSVQQQPNIMGEKARQSRESYAFNVVSQELDNIDNLKTQQQPTNTFEYGKQFLKDREGAPKQKTQEESLQEIDNQIKTLYPNLQTKGVDEDGNEVYTEDFTKGIGAIYLSEQQRQQQAIDEQRARVTEYENVHPIFKPLLTVANATDALFFDIASLATQMVGAEELTQGLRDQANKYQQEGSALKMSSGITQEQLENGAFATMGEDPIAAFKLLGYQTVEAIPSMAAIVLAPEVSVGRTGALQVGRSAAQQFVTPMSTNVYKETLKQASKTLGTRSNAGITALAGLEARSSYEEALNSGLTQAEALAISMIKGTAVYATEHVFMGAEDMVRNSLINFGEEAAKKEIKQSVKDFVKEAGEQFTKEGLLEEGTPNLIGQILDNLTQGKPFNIYSYLDESAVGGLMGVGSVTTKAVLDNTSNLVSTTLTNSKLKQVGKQIRALREELLKQDLTPQERKLIEAELVATQKEYENVKRSSDDMINMFTNEEKKRYIEINRELLSINDEFQKTENEAVKKILTDKANKLQQEKQAIEQKYSNQEVTNQEVTAQPPAQETPTETPATTTTSEENLSQKSATLATAIDEETIKAYDNAVELGDIDESLISQLEDEEIQRAYSELENEEKKSKLEGGADKFMFIHENLGRIRPQDFDQYGDKNQRVGNRGFSIKYLSGKASPLDTKMMELSDMFGQELTEQDAIGYILDREQNPDKYRGKNKELSKLRAAANIDLSTSAEAYQIYTNLKNDKKSFDYLEKLKGTVLSDEQVEIIKNHLSQVYEKTESANKEASRGLQQPNETSKRGKEKQITDDTQGKQQVRGTQQQSKQDVGKPQQQKASDETTRSDRDKQEATEKEVESVAKKTQAEAKKDLDKTIQEREVDIKDYTVSSNSKENTSLTKSLVEYLASVGAKNVNEIKRLSKTILGFELKSKDILSLKDKVRKKLFANDEQSHKQQLNDLMKNKQKYSSAANINEKEALNIINSIAELDLSRLPKTKQEHFYRDVQNMLMGDFSGMSWIPRAVRLQKGTNGILAFLEKEQKSRLRKIGARSEYIGNVQAMFTNMALNNDLAAKIMTASGISDIFNAQAQAKKFQSSIEDTYVILTNKIDKNKAKGEPSSNSLEQRAIRSWYAFLSQATDEADFLDKVNYIDKSIDSFSKNGNKQQREDSTILRRLFDSRIKGSTQLSDVKTFSSTKKVVDFWRSTFSDQNPKYANMKLRVRGDVYDEGDNYTPFKYKNLEDAQIDIDPFEADFTEDGIPKKETYGSVERIETKKLNPEKRPLSYDFDENMISEVTKREFEILVSDYVLQTTEALKYYKSMFGQDPDIQRSNVDHIKRYVKNYLKSSNIVMSMSETESFLSSFANETANWGTKIALGNLAQLIKQPTVLFRALINLRNRTGLKGFGKAFFSFLNPSNKANMKRLLNQFPIGTRSYTKYGFKELMKKIPPAQKQNFVSRFKRNVYMPFRNFTDKTMLWALEASDAESARISWIAFYADYLYKNEGVKEIDWAKEANNPNKEAAAYAENLVATTQQASDVKQTGSLSGGVSSTGESNQAVGLVRTAFFPFLTFSLNRANTVLTNLKKVSTGSKTEKIEGAKDLAGIMMEDAAFVGARIVQYGIYGLIAKGILGLLGVDAGDDDEDVDENKKNIYKAMTSGVMAITPLYGLGLTDKSVNSWANRLYFEYALTNDEKEEFFSKADWTKMQKDIGEKGGFETEMEQAHAINKALNKFSMSSKVLYYNYKQQDVDMGKYSIPISTLLNVKETYSEWAAPEGDKGESVYQYENSFGGLSEKNYNQAEQDALLVSALLQSSQFIGVPSDVANIGRRIRYNARKSETNRSGNKSGKKATSKENK